MFWETEPTNRNFIDRNIRYFHWWNQVRENEEVFLFSELELKTIENMLLNNELAFIIKNDN